MRRIKKSGGASLDSLLDTMTNVVGILVILLTVTQLGVSDAVKRISTTESVDPQAYEELQQRLAEVFKIHEDLRKRRDAFQVDESQEDTALELRIVKKKLEDARHDVDVLTSNRLEDRLARELELKQLIDEANRLIDEQKREEKELAARVNKAEDELAKLRARLAETPERGPVPAKVISLPNPRPAPEGKEQVLFLCREGRIMHVDVENLQDRAQKRAEYLVQRKRLHRGPEEGVDGEALVKEFNRDNTIRDPDFNVQLEVRGRLPRLVLARKEDAGETTDQLTRSSSQYRRTIGRIDPREYYLRYLVWPDSFETYLEARTIADDRGLDAGWLATTMQGEYAINLGGDLRVGPPPKPQPKPAEPAEPAASPPPRPKPPADVID